jgi:hypothetical protein
LRQGSSDGGKILGVVALANPDCTKSEHLGSPCLLDGWLRIRDATGQYITAEAQEIVGVV